MTKFIVYTLFISCYFYKMKPIFPYPGGKSRDLVYLCSHFPKKINTYVEPFVGGGSVFFKINPQKACINDIDPGVTNFYQQIKDGKAEEINNYLKTFKNNKEDYYAIKESFKPKNDIEKAFQFYYLTKYSFMNMLLPQDNGTFKCFYGYAPFNNIDLYVTEHIALLKRTRIGNNDFSYVFKQFQDDPENFIFCDPPYIDSNCGYTETWVYEKIFKLYELFTECKAKCLIVLEGNPVVYELFKDYIKDLYEKTYTISAKYGKKKSVTMYIIKNYE